MCMLHKMGADVLCVICTRLRLDHLSVCVGDSLWGSEEIVKILESRLSR